MEEKLSSLRSSLKSKDRAIIAFSGGVDSSFLAKIAYDELKNKAIAVTVKTPSFPESELTVAKKIAKEIGIQHKIIYARINHPNFKENRPDRCYHCKTEILKTIKELAVDEHIDLIMDATNYDDLNEYRPGLKALHEQGIQSPLIENKFTKDEIRSLSRQMNLSSWNRPSFACLATRIPYESEITEEKLKTIESAEEILKKLNLKNFRIRHHNDLARIETDKNEISTILENSAYITESLKALGYRHITLDLEGYKKSKPEN